MSAETVNFERVLRRAADAVHNLVADETSTEDTRTLREGAELIRCLARVVAGKTLPQAFGAPGDWGYETPIGDAYYRYLSTPKCVDTE